MNLNIAFLFTVAVCAYIDMFSNARSNLSTYTNKY